jgi:hypothetical protein
MFPYIFFFIVNSGEKKIVNGVEVVPYYLPFVVTNIQTKTTQNW